MKVLHLNLYYQLPDDFEGTYEDAILSYLEYRKQKGLSPNSPIVEETDENFDDPEVHWNVFWDAIHTTVYKSALSYSLSKLNPGDNTWANLPEGKA